jgi:hypothetical protein
MMLACATFDTLSFVKKLEAAGVEPKIAEAQMELQAELQAQLLENQAEVEKKFLEKFAEYQPILDEIKIIKSELATKGDITQLANTTKGDITQLENKLDKFESKFESKIENVRNELVIRLGGIVVGTAVVLGAVMPFLINHVH